MKQMQPYLFFDGNCREALTFYGKAFGVEPNIMTYGQMPPQPPSPQDAENKCAEGADMEASKDRVMHGSIQSGEALLMASDKPVGGAGEKIDGFAVNIDCSSAEEQDKFFAALGEGGQVMMPLSDTFWGARFGMLTDKFGVHWMFNYAK